MYAMMIVMPRPTKVNVLGLGYVGVATCIYLSKLGHDVAGCDIDPQRVGLLKNGTLPYPDRDLLDCYETLQQEDKNFTAFHSVHELPSAGIWIIAVGTPLQGEGGYDLGPVREATAQVFEILLERKIEGAMVLLRSTLPPGAMQSILLPEAASRFLGAEFAAPDLAYFPEFFREGSALKDSANPPLSVIGVESNFSRKQEIEELFSIPKDKLEVCDPSSAELVKSFSNVFHALKVCFANEMGAICKSLGVSGSEVMRIFSKDTTLNISPAYLRPGFSFSGPCLEKEVGGLEALASGFAITHPVLSSIRDSNQAHTNRYRGFIAGLEPKPRSLGVLGVGFKTDTNDTRNSAVLRLLDQIHECKMVDDFHLLAREKKLSHRSYFKYVESFDEFLERSDLILLGSQPLSTAEYSMLLRGKKTMLDLGINFAHESRLKHLANYHSIV